MRPPPGEGVYVVVAGLTGDDEHHLEQALALDPTYVAFVGSRKRLGEVTARLRERGLSPDLLARVKGPAGLDIGAVTAFEIAVSIMAEIVQHRRRGRLAPSPAHRERAVGIQGPHGRAAPESRELRGRLAAGGEGPSPVPDAIDPVCGMRVAIPGARHVVQHAGQDYYFCCPSCRRLFAAKPEQYLSAATAAPDHGETADEVPG